MDGDQVRYPRIAPPVSGRFGTQDPTDDHANLPQLTDRIGEEEHQGTRVSFSLAERGAPMEPPEAITAFGGSESEQVISHS
jgi:hypothetical protein